ncbi:alanine racemase [Polymorphum gilvum]|uniref:Pyridoxal-dependent decarboxylase, C-terminal sheet domain protein n=1 Tax=Polymorphum gilvum (strain LMG 25793 / CGMCC 1.9160 / SL003B-26A1) TaxID=991905 RepID=F2J1F7_POLGS|nr:alanine racemase [Polymorphum gilvum]ADZ69739.1 Pyridoxal-dependent decarboxylase, C-terminal sheet domain protein [Polymorphum gilvum SL003B-26A1]
MERYQTAVDAALSMRPDQPVYCFRPKVLAEDARRFAGLFPGKTAYAVKTNGEPFVLATLAQAGIDCFDVASPAEFAAVRGVAPSAEMLYMHPVKAQSHIRLALETYRIRTLSLDHEDEVAKILRVVRALDIDPGDITLFVRIATKGQAAYELSKKFGAAPAHAVELLQRIDRIGFRCGLCFHVGSQIEDPQTYERALASADWIRSRAGVPIVALDVGGGFPAVYGHDPRRRTPEMPSLEELMAQLRQDISDWGFDTLPLVAEPGRVIVARSISLVVRVLLKKGRRLYINDGIWASLSDSWTGKITLPARFIPDPARKRRAGNPDEIVPFKVCGATCDSVDILSRPFWLPETVDTGDWIEIGHIGAYSLSLRTHFNGFYPDTVVEVETPFEAGEAPSGFASIETMAD